MMLHLVHIPLRPSALAQWAADRGWVGMRGFDEGRALHHLLSETFGPAVSQPFRLLVTPRQDSAALYIYSASDDAALRAMAREIAPPDHLAVLSLEAIRSKPLPDFPAGRSLGFDLLVRPVRRLRRPLGRFGAGAELDAFLAHVLRQHPDAPPEVQEAARETIYLDWLAERLAPAADLDPQRTRLVAFRRRRVSRGSRESEGPEATFHGTLTVADPARFVDLLARGVGRHRAYGYGMMLLRAPHRRSSGKGHA